MDIKNAVSVYFSPTDSTHRILSAITKELPWPVQELDITDYPADDGEYRLSACRSTADAYRQRRHSA